MTILEFADKINYKIVIVYYPKHNNFRTCFENATLDHNFGTFGNGKNPLESLNNYTKIISKQIIIFNDKETFHIPELSLIFLNSSSAEFI